MPEAENAVRVMLVDDHEVVRQGLKALIESEPSLTVVGEAGTVADAVERAAVLRPDIIVMDVRLADGSGIEATREIRAKRPETRVIMLTSFSDDEALFASIMAGASGYVLKQIKGNDLVRSIKTVAEGASLLDPTVTEAVLDRLRKGKQLFTDEKLARLSPQEDRILTLVADGKTNREIGESMKLAEKTIKNYVSAILTKLEVSRRAEAAAYLARHTTTPGSSSDIPARAERAPRRPSLETDPRVDDGRALLVNDHRIEVHLGDLGCASTMALTRSRTFSSAATSQRGAPGSRRRAGSS